MQRTVWKMTVRQKAAEWRTLSVSGRPCRLMPYASKVTTVRRVCFHDNLSTWQMQSIFFGLIGHFLFLFRASTLWYLSRSLMSSSSGPDRGFVRMFASIKRLFAYNLSHTILQKISHVLELGVNLFYLEPCPVSEAQSVDPALSS